MSITTVIFDWGGVLSPPPTTADFEPLRRALGLEFSAFQELYWRQRDPFDLDEISAAGYWGEIVRAAGKTGTAAEVQKLEALDGELWSRLDPVLVEWVRVLREQKFKLGILSNMSRSVGGHLLGSFKWLELFDHLCFSSNLKIGKPDPAIYHACLKALGAPAGDALFIDDREVNIAGAIAAGMHGALFRTADLLLPDLRSYGLADTLAEARDRVAASAGPAV